MLEVREIEAWDHLPILTLRPRVSNGKGFAHRVSYVPTLAIFPTRRVLRRIPVVFIDLGDMMVILIILGVKSGNSILSEECLQLVDVG